MGQLENSWFLEERLNQVDCSKELKVEIDVFIKKNSIPSKGKRMSFSNISYRGNLHYIEDNIKKPGLVDELRAVNATH